MQINKTEREKSNAHFAGHEAPSRFCQRIGSTIYTINIYRGTPKSERLEDKILRMMKNDLKSMLKNVIIDLPQVEWLSERGSA